MLKLQVTSSVFPLFSLLALSNIEQQLYPSHPFGRRGSWRESVLWTRPVLDMLCLHDLASGSGKGVAFPHRCFALTCPPYTVQSSLQKEHEASLDMKSIAVGPLRSVIVGFLQSENLALVFPKRCLLNDLFVPVLGQEWRAWSTSRGMSCFGDSCAVLRPQTMETLSAMHNSEQVCLKNV